MDVKLVLVIIFVNHQTGLLVMKLGWLSFYESLKDVGHLFNRLNN